MELNLTAETVADLVRTRALLEAAADGFHQEWRRYEAAAESALYDRNSADGQVDRISDVLGDRKQRSWQRRAAEQAGEGAAPGAPLRQEPPGAAA
jgi:hypothetical protein